MADSDHSQSEISCVPFARILGVTPYPISSDRALILAVVDFVNGETNLDPVRSSWRFRLALETGWTPPMRHEGEGGAEIDEDLSEKQEREIIKDSEIDLQIDDDRKKAKRVLAEATSSIESLRTRLKIFAKLTEGSLGIVRRAIVKQVGDSLDVDWRFEVDRPVSGVGSDLTQVLSYAAAVLISDLERCRSDLSVCRLENCGRFFLVRRGGVGKPRTSYCCDAHMRAAHEKDSARRHRMMKERKRLARQSGRRQKLLK